LLSPKQDIRLKEKVLVRRAVSVLEKNGNRTQ